METTLTDSDVLYQVSAIAAFLGMPEKAARHRIATGEIPTFKIGRSICARRSTLNAWIAEREATALAAQHRPQQGG